MLYITNFITRYLALLIILVAVATYYSPIYLEVSTTFPGLLLAIVIFFTGLSMNVKAIKDIRAKKRELLIATLLKWIVMVLVSIGLAHLFFSSKPEIAAGLILAGTVPSATSAVVYTFLAGGNTSLVVAASLLDVIISPVVTPVALISIVNAQVDISISSLLLSFLLIVIIPLAIGIFLQRVFPNLSTHSRNITRIGSSLALLLIVHTIIGNGREAIASEFEILHLIALATVLQITIPMVTAYYIALKLKINDTDARGILFHVGLANTALAAILAYQFIGDVGAIAPIMNVVFNTSIGAVIANYFADKKRH
ncbi:bile acid:sodium symporter [Desulfuribacillus alkaliarsenatis]|uniref:Bile acid:sodium symporter n=1 Tax=Desulfuribacillus alkaliarsenatis TaxID=766136 RepID=A0A1E5G4T9_9FIRM|nr:bile acid:sodium symporter [Desulfuribacillus alkaliarsenatis]